MPTSFRNSRTVRFAAIYLSPVAVATISHATRVLKLDPSVFSDPKTKIRNDDAHWGSFGEFPRWLHRGEHQPSASLRRPISSCSAFLVRDNEMTWSIP